MKFSCDRHALIEALSITQKGVSSKTTMPILEGIMFQVYDNQLVLTGTDMEIGVQTSIPASIEQDGEIILASNLISEVIRKLSGEEVFFTKDDHNQIKIECLLSDFIIKGLPTDEFPDFPEIEGENSFKIEAAELSDMIRGSIVSVATSDTIPVLKGLKMEIDEDNLTLIGLDGYRLAVKKGKIDKKIETSLSVIVPGRSFGELSKLISGYTGEVIVQFTKNQIFFTFDQTRFTSRLLQGEFINYKHIIPSEKTTMVETNRQDFLNSIERAALLAREGKNNLIKMDFNQDEVIITSNAVEVGEVKDIIPIKNSGESLKIAFNSKYLIEALKVIKDDEIKIEMTTSVGPAVIPDENNNYLYLILPVRLAEEV